MIIAYRQIKRQFKNQNYLTNLLCIGGNDEEMFQNELKETLKQNNFKYNPEIKAWETSNVYDINTFVDTLLIHKQYDDARFILDLIDEVTFQHWTFIKQNDTNHIIGKMKNYQNELENLGFNYSTTPIPHWHTQSIIDSTRDLENLPIALEEDLKKVIKNEDYKPIIRINGSLVYLINLKTRVIKEIASRLRYFDKTAYQNPRYQNGNWDGYVDLYDYQSQSVPIGYINKVKQVLEEFDIDYVIEDNRRKPTTINLEWNKYDLRDYQSEIVDKALQQQSGFIVAPTGSGKTVMAMRIIYELGYSALIVTNKLELLYQWKNNLEQTLGKKVGIIGDDEFYEHDLTVCTVQTAHNKKPLQNYDIFIVDEAHRLPADTFYELSKHIDSLHRFGFSATPERSDGAEKRFIAMTGRIINPYSARDLIDMGYLAEPKFKIIDGWKGRAVSNSQWADLIWQEELSEACHDEDTNRRIVDKALSLHSNGHYVYIDVRRINHGQILKKLFDERENVQSEFIYGKHDKDTRQKVFNRFKNDRIILISTLVKEGVDLPEMSSIILAGPAKSNVENIQKVGRALRPKEGLNEAIIVDRKDNGKFLRRWFKHRQKLFKQYYNF